MIPEELAKRIREFLEKAKTGKVSLNVNQGRVESWDITEHGRVARKEVDNEQRT